MNLYISTLLLLISHALFLESVVSESNAESSSPKGNINAKDTNKIEPLDLDYAIPNLDPLNIKENPIQLQKRGKNNIKAATTTSSSDSSSESQSQSSHSSSKTSSSAAPQLQDWDPIAATISAAQNQQPVFYTFPIDYNATGTIQSYEILIFLSASICTQPQYYDDSEDYYNGLNLYWTFNNTETDVIRPMKT
ncbi:unnamed protein product [Ambrosiozyma monospora]|uniref:Unnamed protein product n=1 Tax=Ambrosiozyma monospora TaxID=43982 RepID=A0ACB5TTZ3_AMBMO|nr:unnamed protein product [Ambrosiozyma monospora]